MKKYLIFYCAVIALMIADSLFLLRDNGLIREEGVNLLLNVYVIGVSMVLMLNRLRKRRPEQEVTPRASGEGTRYPEQ